MTGLFVATPSDKCVRYWAASALLIALGVLIVTLNAGALRPAVLMTGNTALVFGLILQWCGIQVFYNQKPDRLAWMLGAGFFILFGLLVLVKAATVTRSLFISVWVLAFLILSLLAIWNGQKDRRTTFGCILALASMALSIVCYIGRVVGNLYQLPEFLPTSGSPVGIFMIYLGPMAGAQLLFSGLLLLYFEKIVREKNYLAAHDALTGLLNRRAIDAAGERELEIAQRLRHSLGIAFVDIDCFKRINDNFGHEAGDHVLAEVAHILRKTCRSIDLAGRNGGDEFCLILPGLQPEDIAAMGDRLVTAVRNHQFRTVGQVSVSVGLAMSNAAAAEDSWPALLKRADVELYKAKSQGRNRFSVSSPASDRCCQAA
jgi:diguanylate cyclase (GGDEF)-like protein